jgi:mortality factor 4-like protein 1
MHLSFFAATNSLSTVKMPEMIAQTNMDVQTVNRLREEIAKMVLWMAKNVPALFVMGYEAPPPEYVERAKGA